MHKIGLQTILTKQPNENSISVVDKSAIIRFICYWYTFMDVSYNGESMGFVPISYSQSHGRGTVGSVQEIFPQRKQRCYQEV